MRLKCSHDSTLPRRCAAGKLAQGRCHTLLSFALYSDAETSDFVVDRKRSLRPRSAGQKPGGSPEGLPHIFPILRMSL